MKSKKLILFFLLLFRGAYITATVEKLIETIEERVKGRFEFLNSTEKSVTTVFKFVDEFGFSKAEIEHNFEPNAGFTIKPIRENPLHTVTKMYTTFNDETNEIFIQFAPSQSTDSSVHFMNSGQSTQSVTVNLQNATSISKSRTITVKAGGGTFLSPLNKKYNVKMIELEEAGILNVSFYENEIPEISVELAAAELKQQEKKRQQARRKRRKRKKKQKKKKQGQTGFEKTVQKRIFETIRQEYEQKIAQRKKREQRELKKVLAEQREIEQRKLEEFFKEELYSGEEPESADPKEIEQPNTTTFAELIHQAEIEKAIRQSRTKKHEHGAIVKLKKQQIQLKKQKQGWLSTIASWITNQFK